MLQIYTLTNGDLYREVFNAIATLTSSSTFYSLMYIAGIFAVIAMAKGWIQQHSYEGLIKSYANYFVLSFILLGVQVPVQIVDLSNPMKADLVVDHVPYGLAMPASLSSEIGSALTRLFDAIFHMPKDQSYISTGVVFGASLMREGNNIGITNPDTRKLFNDYFTNCVVGDIKINHKYTMDQLVHSGNILEMITEKASPVRGLYTDNGYQTCAQAAVTLKKALLNNPQLLRTTNQQLRSSLPRLSTGNSAQDPSVDMANAYTYFGAMSQTAKQILVQNMMISGTRAGLKTFDERTGSTAGLISMTATQAWEHKLLTMLGAAQVAQKYMPILFAVLTLMIYGMFPLVVVLGIATGEGIKYMSKYVGGFLWIWTWPVLYCILNFIATYVMKTQTLSLLKDSGLTLSNANQVASISTGIVGVCGMLMLAIPYLSRGLYAGVASVFTQIAQSLTSTLNGSLSNAAGGIASGNESIGNVNYNNMNANKFDANRTHYEGTSSTNLGNNAILTRTANGGEVLNTSGATSVLPMGFNLNQAERSSIAEDQQKNTALATSQSRSVSEALSNTMGIIDQHGHSLGDVSSYGDSAVTSDDAKAASAYKSLQNTVHDYAKSQGISDSHAMTAAFEGHLGGGVPIPGVNVGGSASVNHANTWGHSHDASEKFTAVQQSTIDHDISTIKSAHLSNNSSNGHSSSLSSMHQLQSSLNNLDSASQAYNQTMTQSQNLSHRADQLKSSGADQNANEAQAYHNFIMENHAGEASKLFDPNNSQVMRDNQPYVKEFMRSEGLSPSAHNLGVSPKSNYAAGKSMFDSEVSNIASGARSAGQRVHRGDADIYDGRKNAHMANANYAAYQHMMEANKTHEGGFSSKAEVISNAAKEDIYGSKNPSETTLSKLETELKRVRK